jgi:hypothetical protein
MRLRLRLWLRLRLRLRLRSRLRRRRRSARPISRAAQKRNVRLHHWRVAAGSADEVRTALRVAVAWGDLDEPDAAEALGLLDRVLAMLWKLTH